MLVFSTIYSMRLLTLIILWILRHCYLVAQLYLFLGSVPRYYLGLNEKVKINSCFLMCCRTSCSKKHLFIKLRNCFLSHSPRGDWLTCILKHRSKLGKGCPDRWVQLLDTLGNLGLETLLCRRADSVYSLAVVLRDSAEAFLAWVGHLVRDTWIWIMALKTQRLEMGLLLNRRAVGSETGPGRVPETKSNC